MAIVEQLIQAKLIEKLKTKEVAEKIKQLFSVLEITRKAEAATEHFRIFAWTAMDPMTQKRSVSIRIEEV